MALSSCLVSILFDLHAATKKKRGGHDWNSFVGPLPSALFCYQGEIDAEADHRRSQSVRRPMVAVKPPLWKDLKQLHSAASFSLHKTSTLCNRSQLKFYELHCCFFLFLFMLQRSRELNRNSDSCVAFVHGCRS